MIAVVAIASMVLGLVLGVVLERARVRGAMRAARRDHANPAPLEVRLELPAPRSSVAAAHAPKGKVHG